MKETYKNIDWILFQRKEWERIIVYWVEKGLEEVNISGTSLLPSEKGERECRSFIGLSY
jgi:hypothetical protein